METLQCSCSTAQARSSWHPGFRPDSQNVLKLFEPETSPPSLFTAWNSTLQPYFSSHDLPSALQHVQIVSNCILQRCKKHVQCDGIWDPKFIENPASWIAVNISASQKMLAHLVLQQVDIIQDARGHENARLRMINGLLRCLITWKQ